MNFCDPNSRDVIGHLRPSPRGSPLEAAHLLMSPPMYLDDALICNFLLFCDHESSRTLFQNPCSQAVYDHSYASKNKPSTSMWCRQTEASAEQIADLVFGDEQTYTTFLLEKFSTVIIESQKHLKTIQSVTSLQQSWHTPPHPSLMHTYSSLPIFLF